MKNKQVTKAMEICAKQVREIPCARCSDVYGSGRYMRSNQEITTEFIY